LAPLPCAGGFFGNRTVGCAPDAGTAASDVGEDVVVALAFFVGFLVGFAVGLGVGLAGVVVDVVGVVVDGVGLVDELDGAAAPVGSSEPHPAASSRTAARPTTARIAGGLT
jgi:hypothetical protein